MVNSGGDASVARFSPALLDHYLPNLIRPRQGRIVGGAAFGDHDLRPVADDELPSTVALFTDDALRGASESVRKPPRDNA